MKKWRSFWVLLIISAIAFLAYRQLFDTFFQQDEWLCFGAVIHGLSTTSPILNIVLPFQGDLTHFYPLTMLFYAGEYLLFKTNFFPYVLVALIWHIINGWLLFTFIRIYFKNKMIAFISALIFAVNSFSHQAVSWISAGIGTLHSTTFLLLSLIFFAKFLQFKKKKSFYFSLICFITSFLFKEISLFLFIFLPFFWLFHYRIKRFELRKQLKIFKKETILFCFLSFSYLLLRILFFFGFRSPQPSVSDQSFFPISALFFRLFSVPVKGLSQSFFPDRFIFKISELIVQLAYPNFLSQQGTTYYDLIIETIGADLVLLFLAAILLVSFLILYKLFKDRLILFFFVFILLGSLPFVFIAGPAGYFSIFEPRNLYIINIGSSALIASFLYQLANSLTDKKRAEFFMILFLIPLMGFHLNTIWKDLADLKAVSRLRKSFLETIKNTYPKLPSKVVFYTSSDTPYYGLPEEEKILPVQSGFGKMLMVWYQDEEKFPGCLYEKQYLYDLLSQGYKFCQGRGFGYFRQDEELKKAVAENQFSIENVIAYSWEKETERFQDISEELRQRLNKELSFSQNIDKGSIKTESGR